MTIFFKKFTFGEYIFIFNQYNYRFFIFQAI